jgi:FkbM family methyltransferase
MGHQKGNPAEWIRRTVKRGQVVIDGGANVGGFTLAAAESVGDAGRVYAVEPDSRCHAALDELAQRYPQITVIKAALGAHAGMALLHRAIHTEQTSLQRHAVDNLVDTIEVTTYALDDIVRCGPVHAIKLDLQGGECDALAGAEAMLRICPQWCVELWPPVLGERAFALLETFKGAGLTAHWMDEDEPVADWDDLAAWCAADLEKSQHINLLLTA